MRLVLQYFRLVYCQDFFHPTMTSSVGYFWTGQKRFVQFFWQIIEWAARSLMIEGGRNTWLLGKRTHVDDIATIKIKAFCDFHDMELSFESREGNTIVGSILGDYFSCNILLSVPGWFKRGHSKVMHNVWMDSIKFGKYLFTVLSSAIDKSRHHR